MLTRDAAHELTIETVSCVIDYALLAPDHTFLDVDQACVEAIRSGFAAVSVSPYAVGYTAKLLRGSGVAAGGINRLKPVSDLLRAGAARIGTAEPIAIIKDFYAWEALNAGGPAPASRAIRAQGII